MKTGYNRNLIGGKRRHKGIQKYGYDKCKTLSERLIAECNALRKYQERVDQVPKQLSSSS